MIGAPDSDISIDLRLKGTLTYTGPVQVNTPSFAGIGMVALGSTTDPNAWSAVFPNGISNTTPPLEAIQAYEAAALNSNAYAQSRIIHLDDFSLDNPKTVDETFSVKASPIAPQDPAVSGRVQIFQRYLDSFAQNAGFSDFMGTLSVEAIHVPVGTQINFSPGQALTVIQNPVPEPTTYAMMLCGLGLIVLAQRKRPVMGRVA